MKSSRAVIVLNLYLIYFNSYFRDIIEFTLLGFDFLITLEYKVKVFKEYYIKNTEISVSESWTRCNIKDAKKMMVESLKKSGAGT